MYVAGFTGGVTIFDRDASTGALAQKAGTAGCISSDGSGGACQKGTAIAGASSVVVSPGRQERLRRRVQLQRRRDLRPRRVHRSAHAEGRHSRLRRRGRRRRSARTAGRSPARRRSPSAPTAGASTRPVVAPRPVEGLAILDRVPATGATAQKAGPAGCVTDGGSEGACQDSGGIDSFYDVTVSPRRRERVRHGGAEWRDRAVRPRRERRADAEPRRRARRRGQRGRRQPRRPQRVRRHARDELRRHPRPCRRPAR